MARIGDVTFDAVHAASLARFWAALLDDYEVAAYDDAEIERLASMGIHDVEDDPGVLVEGPVGAPRLFFQKVPEPKTAKSRVHLDVRCDDAEAELERAIGLGATFVERHDEFIVMQDPQGNEFCILVPR